MMTENTIELGQLINSQTIIVCTKHWYAVTETDDFEAHDADSVIEDVCNAVGDTLESLIYSDASQTIAFIQKLSALLESQSNFEGNDSEVAGQNETQNHCSVSYTGLSLTPCES
jgi:hypothetical protein